VPADHTVIVSTEPHFQKQPTHLSTSTETLSLVWTVWRGTGVSWILTSGGVSGVRDGDSDGDTAPLQWGNARNGEGTGPVVVVLTTGSQLSRVCGEGWEPGRLRRQESSN
jgi:hypothetical protein